MSTAFRIASFNVENLFSRARVLNLGDHNRAKDLLTDIAELNRLIGKNSYTAADKKKILKLSKALSYYILFREDRGKLFSGVGSNRRVKANGAGDWDGEIELRRGKFSEMARKSTADVIKALKADVVCVVEAENRPTLVSFNTYTLPRSARFDYVMAIDGNDTRGIDVGLLSRFKLGDIRSHVYDRDSRGRIFSRDCLEIDVQLPNQKPLTVLCNHLKSKGYGSQAENDAKRKRQTKQISKILGDYDLSRDFVVVAGDMNDTPGSDPMKPLLDVRDLHDVLELGFGSDMNRRWTYKYRSQKNQIDYVLVSKPLKEAFQSAGVERRGIYGIKSITGQTPFKSVTRPSDAASDHGGIWAEFSV
jgi:endonuclease/exonuclease/phosphatase family metal-dependent hydrolase